MLGSMLYFKYDISSDFEVAAVIREPIVKRFKLNEKNICDPDILNFDRNLRRKILAFKPEVIVNCIGSIKQKTVPNSQFVLVNSYFPHLLDEFCIGENIRLVHFSTDCVFFGSKGMYHDYDVHDAKDIYGRSKSLGELNDTKSITLRTSIIGPQLCSNESLLEWFLSQNNEVKGFSKAFFSGLTTTEVSKLVSNILLEHKSLYGVYNLSMSRISKYELLKEIARAFNKKTRIAECQLVNIDRSLDSRRLTSKILYQMPNWRNAIKEMQKDYADYKGYYYV